MKRKFNEDKYSKLINELIEKSFQSLKSKTVIVKELKNSRFTAKIEPFRRNITVRISSRMNKYSPYFNKGVLAHELSHMVDWCSMGWFNFNFLRDLKLCFKKYLREEEIRADKIAIQRGYAKNIANQRKMRFKSNNPKDAKLRKIYWSYNEIKSYAKSIGKWK